MTKGYYHGIEVDFFVDDPKKLLELQKEKPTATLAVQLVTSSEVKKAITVLIPIKEIEIDTQLELLLNK